MRSIRNLLFYLTGIVSSVVLIILLSSDVTYQTKPSEKLIVSLPDESVVMLHANTSLSHKRFFWTSDRIIYLKGEAYFTLEEGQEFEFSIITDQGKVSGLGGRFNVKSRESTFDLSSYKGQVRFRLPFKNENITVVEGKGIKLRERKIYEELIKATEPPWINGLSTFDRAPLSEVLMELQALFDVNFAYDSMDTSARFTGHIPHHSLELSLKVLFIPMGVQYEYNEKSKTVRFSAVKNKRT